MSTHAVIGEAPAAKRGNNRLLLILTVLPFVTLLFVFWVLVPLYNLLCTAGGAQLNPNDMNVAYQAGGPTGRFVDVFLEPRVFDGLPIEFTVEQNTMRAEVGVDAGTVFHLRNTSDQTVHLRPIHLVSPPLAAKHFGMKVCFCFNDQIIEPGGEREFPVLFAFGRDLDPRISMVTIGYTILKTVEGESAEASEARVHAAVEGQGTIVTPGFTQEAQP